MRTRIAASWIVGHQHGRHALIRDGVLVYENNRILYVGKAFDGPVERTIDATGKLVAPGFIDTHVHSGHRASHRLITDTGRPMYYGQPFLEIQRAQGRARSSRATRATSSTATPDRRPPSSSTPPSPLPSSCATASPPSSNSAASCSVQDALLAEVTRLGGARLSRRRATTAGAGSADDDGRLKRVRDDALGR